MEAAEVKSQRGACDSPTFYLFPSSRDISQASGQPSGGPPQMDRWFLLLTKAMTQCSELPPVHL